MTVTPVSAPQVRRAEIFLRALYREFRESNVSFVAGGIAYSAFVSLLPLLVLLFLLASAVGGEMFAQVIVEMTGTYLSPAGQEILVTSLSRASERAELSVLTLGIFGWGTFRLLRGLSVAFSMLYEDTQEKGMLRQVADGVMILGALGVAVVGTVTVAVVVTAVPGLPESTLLDSLVLILFLFLVFLPIYYVFPDTELTLREVVPGALVAAVGWTLLQYGFRFYVMISDKTELYGVVGGVLLLITWLYLGALTLLFGASVNVVLGRSSWTEHRTD